MGKIYIYTDAKGVVYYDGDMVKVKGYCNRREYCNMVGTIHSWPVPGTSNPRTIEVVDRDNKSHTIMWLYGNSLIDIVKYEERGKDLKWRDTM